jgi:ABC-type multidrug transport system ATPase subunit
MPVTFHACRFAYRRHRPVFTNLDLTLPEGLSVLLGPNGAGKSTLLGLAASVLQPAAGTVTYRGRDTRRTRDRRAHRRAVGFMPQHIAPVPGLTVREQVAYAAWLKGSNRADAWSASAAALARVGLTKLDARRSHELSGGQLRRVGLAQSLVHDAEVVLMDEPTAGLDPRQAERFVRLLAEVTQDTHVVVSTHQIADVADVYTTVTVLDRGVVRFQGSTGEFLSHAASGRAAAAAYASLVDEEE